MSDVRYFKRQVAAERQKRKIEEKTKRLCELVADLPFRKNHPARNLGKTTAKGSV